MVSETVTLPVDTQEAPETLGLALTLMSGLLLESSASQPHPKNAITASADKKKMVFVIFILKSSLDV
jgi:hypothetical protein